MGTDVSCNLGSTNVVNMMTSPDFGRSIRAMVRALTFVTDSSHIVAVPTIDHGNKLAHTFGLGAMGLHSYLAQQLIEYGSPESIEFTSIYFMLMNYWTLVESNNIARNVVLPSTTSKNLIMPMVLTLISTRLENLYQNLIASKNSLKISLSQVLRIGQNCVLKFKQMVFTTKTA